MYIRECYYLLWDTIVHPYLESHDTEALQITGTPGIGKTTFIPFLLWQLRKLGKKVILIYQHYSYIMFNDGRIPERVSEFSYTNHEDAIFISDPGKAVKSNHSILVSAIPTKSRYIIISSPDNKHVKHVKDIDLIREVMPLWSFEEIMNCNKMVYHRDENELEELFWKFGHTPRVCFNRKSIRLERELNDCIMNTENIEAMVKHMFNDAFTGKMEQYIIMDGVSSRDWATTYIKQKFLGALHHVYTSFLHRKAILEGYNHIYMGDIYEVHVKERLYKFIDKEDVNPDIGH